MKHGYKWQVHLLYVLSLGSGWERATGESSPLRGPEGVPSLPGAPQDEAVLTRKFETSHVGGFSENYSSRQFSIQTFRGVKMF